MIQGLTEFLPVSSSGHLVLGAHFLGLAGTHLLFEVVVHGGTLVAVVGYYRHALRAMAVQTWQAVRGADTFGQGFAEQPDFRLAVLVAAGTVPTVAIALLFRAPLEALFAAPNVVPIALVLTGLALLGSRWLRAGERGALGMTVYHAVLIGLIQGAAIVPGISRSGSTIVVALALGLQREFAAKFSFLLAIPAIAGALILHVGGAFGSGGIAMSNLAVGFVVSAAVGWGALVMLIPLVRQGRLHYFAYYLLPVGAAGLIFIP